MNKILTAVALAIALPAVAHAQTAPPPAAEKDCCEKMKSEGKECCCRDMAGEDHAGHDMKQHDHAPQSESHADHRQ